MATEVIITGTGNPGPDPSRAGAGVLVRCGEVSMQFDAGRSTVQRLAGAGQSVTTLSAFFATHHHSDHLVGLPDLVMTRWTMDRTDQSPVLPLIMPEGPCVTFAEHMLDPWGDDLAIRRHHNGRTRPVAFEVQPFPYPDSVTEVWSQGDVRVLAGQVRHEPVHPAVGFRIETPDGVVAISGDTLVCDEVATEPPHRHFILDYHADTRLIGKQAAELGVTTLMLTHMIPPPNTPEAVALYEADIRDAGYEGELFVSNDLDKVVLG